MGKMPRRGASSVRAARPSPEASLIRHWPRGAEFTELGCYPRATLSSLRVSGCPCFAQTRVEKREKRFLDPRRVLSVIVAFGEFVLSEWYGDIGWYIWTVFNFNCSVGGCQEELTSIQH